MNKTEKRLEQAHKALSDITKKYKVIFKPTINWTKYGTELGLEIIDNEKNA